VLNPWTSRRQPRRWFSPLLAVGFALSACSFVHAATLSATFFSVPDCSATGSDWSCYLPGILRFLSVIAIVLGVILAAVVALAVKSYLKNKAEKQSED
jgi:uncharacterized membrane protein YphA (DoxX/SURF4 family)